MIIRSDFESTPPSSLDSILVSFPCVADLRFGEFVLFTMDLSQRISLSQGVDSNEVLPRLTKLVDAGWELNEDGTGIQKRFHFNAYTKVVVWNHQMPLLVVI